MRVEFGWQSDRFQALSLKHGMRFTDLSGIPACGLLLASNAV